MFEFFFNQLNNEKYRTDSGFTSPLQNWRDAYGMTFLMRLLVESTETKGKLYVPEMDLLIQNLIKRKFFDAEYINTKSELELGPQFDQQHILGIASEHKKTNTVISKAQLIPTKRIEKLNTETGEYEPFAMDGQIKVVSKDKVKVIENGEERTTRVMITAQKPEENISFHEYSSNEIVDEGCFQGDENLPDSVSLDNDESEDENQIKGPAIDLEEDCLESKIGRWTANVEPQHQEEIKNKVLRPEHFDKTSVLTKSNETFMTKENKYKYAKSASTRFIETHSIIETPSKHYAKRTTLLLLSCRTEKWKITECILDDYSAAIDVGHKDAEGSNAQWVKLGGHVDI